jgi:hypothetical protein
VELPEKEAKTKGIILHKGLLIAMSATKQANPLSISSASNYKVQLLPFSLPEPRTTQATFPPKEDNGRSTTSGGGDLMAVITALNEFRLHLDARLDRVEDTLTQQNDRIVSLELLVHSLVSKQSHNK